MCWYHVCTDFYLVVAVVVEFKRSMVLFGFAQFCCVLLCLPSSVVFVVVRVVLFFPLITMMATSASPFLPVSVAANFLAMTPLGRANKPRNVVSSQSTAGAVLGSSLWASPGVGSTLGPLDLNATDAALGGSCARNVPSRCGS